MLAPWAGGNKIDNIMVVKSFIISCAIKHHSECPITIGNLFGSGFVFSADDVLGVRGVRGVFGVCKMCLAQGEIGREWVRGLCLGFTNPVETGGV